jgi:uncharacterized protein
MSQSILAVDRHGRTRPRSPKLHLFDGLSGQFALDVEGGHIHRLPPGHASALDAQLALGDPQRAELTASALGLTSRAPIERQVPKTVAVKAISLAVAQKCNLGCTYCYAQQGAFGGAARNMAFDVAKGAIDQLILDAAPGDHVTVAFMGGEPLVNRDTLHAATRYATEFGQFHGVRVGFSLTTNATLLTTADIALFQEHGFAITISVDGLGATHDNQRPYLSGKGSFEKVAANVKSLLAVEQRRSRVHARVTVTPRNLDLPEIMIGLVDMGFDSVMFAPMLSAPSGKDQMHATDLDRLLEQLIVCGEIFKDRLRQGQALPFTNLVTMIKRIHAYRREHYPCGAGGGYVAVAADGDMYACHRFVNEKDGHLGSLSTGVDHGKQADWLEKRHLLQQSPCTTCWARFLCSGSCHYEVMKRGRDACDYIRGWLTYCLAVYADMSVEQPTELRRILESP